MAFTPIADSDFNGHGARSLPDQPTISANELKRVFDEDAREIVAPAVNRLIGELEATSASASVGAVAPTGRTGNTVQSLLNDISTAVDGKSTIQLSNVSTSGVRIATVTINGASTDLMASQGSQGTMDYDDLDNRPQINSNTLTGNKSSADLGLAAASHTHTKSQITDFPTLATVATSGSYNDLSNKPTIPDELADLSDDSTHRVVTDTEKSTWSGKSTVTWNQQVTTGQKIATVSIDGTPTDVYAPTGGGGGGGGNVDSVNGQQGVVVLGVADIDDVTITGIADNDGLVYDSGDWVNKPLSDVAFSGAYNDLSGTPTLATVATSGSYNDLSSKPTIPTVSDTYSGTSGDAMSGKAVKAALQTLDGSITGSPSTSKTLSAFSETDGVVSATFSDISITKSQVSGIVDGHDMPSNANILTAIGSADNTNDKVSSLYGIKEWSNCDAIQILTAVSADDDGVGVWEDDDTWETGSRTGWITHSALYGILSNDDVEIEPVFKITGGDAVGLYAMRIDDAVTGSTGGIALKFTAPITVSGYVGVKLKHLRTNTVIV
jgi:hypothetical protein